MNAILNRFTHALLATAAVLAAVEATAQTTQLSPNVYRLDSGVAITMGNQGASNYLFNWSDDGGTFTNVVDPTLELVIGEIYTFQRTSGSHPFVITDDTLATTGTDGSFSRVTFNGGVIDAATLTPIADFTANPAPTTDLISWTPTIDDLGNYFYTCRVTGHRGMTGALRVVIPEPTSVVLGLMGLAGCGVLSRRRAAE